MVLLHIRRVARAATLAVVAAALGACAFRAGYDDVATDSAPLVPDGGGPIDGPPAVSDGPPASDAPGAPDASDVAPPTPGCGSMFLVRDDFDDGAVAGQWVSIAPYGVTVAETAGVLAVRLASGSFDVEGGYRSRTAYDLRNSAASVEVLRTGGRLTALEVRDNAGRGGAIGVADGRLTAMVVDGDTETRRVTIDYDAALHRYWRLREAGGALSWETSPDRAAWTVLHADVLPMTGTYARAYLVARGQLAAASDAWFDDFNVPETASPGLCPASSTRDDFADGVLPAPYIDWSGSGACTARETGGRLELSFSGFGNAWCTVDAGRLVDLRDDAVFVEVIPATPGTTFSTTFEAVAPSGDRVQMGYGPEGLSIHMLRGGAATAATTLAYSATDHRFWRLRERGGRTFWDTSPDAVTWTSRFSAATAIDISSVLVHMGAGHWWPGPGAPVVTRFDRLNTAP